MSLFNSKLTAPKAEDKQLAGSTEKAWSTSYYLVDPYTIRLVKVPKKRIESTFTNSSKY